MKSCELQRKNEYRSAIFPTLFSLSWWNAASVSQRSWDQTPYGPESFFRPYFYNCLSSSVLINAKIVLSTIIVVTVATEISQNQSK